MTETSTHAARIVADGYDALGARYRDWAADIPAESRDPWVERVIANLPDGSRVLDLGCGTGVPTARRLAERFDVTGVDISAGQIEAARAAVPTAQFRVADMTTIDFPAGAFDAVVALYSMIHVRLAELPGLLRRIHDWLAPNGWLLATFGTEEHEGVQADWLGVPMFFAGHTPERNLALVTDAGFEIVDARVEITVEPGEGDVAFHWVLARRVS